MQLKNPKKVAPNATMDKSPTSLNCAHHQLQIQQIQQQQQRCSSVGSTGSSTCDTLSSHSGSALSPTLPIGHNGYLSKSVPSNATTLAATLSASIPNEKMTTSALSTLSLRSMASRMPLNASPSDTIYPLGATTATTLPAALSTLPLLPALPPPTPLASSATASVAPSTLNVGNIGVSAAAAMAAANLAESFTLLQQQAAHHFQDILYAAHLLGRGYYQPAGPLISPHVLPPVATGPPPPLTNVSLLPATTAATAGGASSKKQQIPTPLSSDPEHLHPAPPSTTSAADSTDSDVLITGGDLTPFRYPVSSTAGTIPPHHQTSQQHQLHQQAAAAASAHQGSPYPRSMHAAQMHYLTAYPPNYYAPYPGEAMCYSPPAAAYQPYFPTKVYQSAPPHPPPGPYRRYPYYQPGPPPPAELYEPAPPPPTNSSSSGVQQGGPPPTQGASQGPPPQTAAGSQLVPAGPTAHAQHLEHYPGPPGYYSGYSPGSAAAGQCYTRTIQGPYMEYPPQCPCPMQQSCPKNVHTGPHIGSNNGNTSSHSSNNSNSSSSNITNNSGSNTTAMNHNSNTIVNGSQSSSSNSGKSTNNSNSSSMPTNANSSNSNTMNTSITNRGPVKNVTSQQLNKTNTFMNSYQQQDLLKTTVKSELKTEESDCKSQYEDHVVQPPTPPESYGTNDDKSLLIEDDIIDEAMEKLEMSRLAAIAANAPTPTTTTISTQHSAAITTTTPTEKVPRLIEAYDLTTTTTPPLMPPTACSVGNSSNNVANNTNSTQQPLVGRKARIGKTMAREMVYAAAATTTSPAQPQQPLIQVRNLPQQNTSTPLAIPAAATTTSTTSATAATTTSTASFATLPLLATIKTEIKAEHIKIEDDIMDTILRQQHISSTNGCNNHEHNELKIKAEPLSSPEAEMNSSRNAVYDILSRLQTNQVETNGNVDQPIQQEPSNVVDTNTITMPKPINEAPMRLSTNWNQPSKVNCEIDLSTVSDDDVLDLRQSPMPGDNSGKRIKILDFQNTPGSCKKSSQNSYKNLIKQAEPKAYLCLSRRRMDKRNRKGFWQRKSYVNVGINMRRRHLLLTEQQQECLKARRRQRQEILRRRKRRLEARQAEQADVADTTQNANEADNQNKKSCMTTNTESTVATSSASLQRLQETAKSSPKRAPKPKKCSAIPLHLLESNEAVARGYFSEPETRCSSVLGSKYGCEHDTSARTASLNKSTLAEINCRKQKKTKMSIAEKRSKSETKKPIKGSAVLHTFPKPEITCLKTQNQDLKETANTTKATSVNGVETMELKAGNDSSAKCNSETTTKVKKQKESKSKHKKATNATKIVKSKSKIAQKRKTTVAEDAFKAMSMETTEEEVMLHNDNTDQSIPRETNNNEIIEKPVTIVDVSSQTPAEQAILKSIPAVETHETSLTSQGEQPSNNFVPDMTADSCSTSLITVNSHSDKAQVFLQPVLPPRILCHSHHYHGKRTRSRAKFGPRKRQKQKHSTVSYELDERPPPAWRGDIAPKWNNGWTWEGESFQGAVFLNSDDPLVIRTCYYAMRHSEGDIIRTRDCVLLKANEDNELPYVAKVAHLWENPEDGEMMVSLLWYYRPEHTEQGRQPSDSPDEVYASRHRDHNSVACIEDKCYVLTFSEYCRYRRRLRATEEDIEDVSIVPKPASSFYSTQKVPDNTNPELVMFCRRAYEFRSKRLLKMPNKQDYYVVNG